MNTELQESLGCWPEWISQFELDPKYGYLIDPTYKPVSFLLSDFNPIMEALPQLSKNKQIIQAINNFPEISINYQIATHNDMVILHDICSYLIHSYIKCERNFNKSDHQISISKNLAMPLCESAGFLEIKTGMATGICYNWYFGREVKDLDALSIDDVEIKYFYSMQKDQEELFFKVSVVTSYFLGRIIKNCYELNCIIIQQPNLTDLALQRFKKIEFYLARIFEANLQIQLKMEPQFFYYVLRNFVSGYQDVYFQGIDQRVSSSGGAGGYDPSFQCFERAFGLYFHHQIGNIQNKLRNGMTKPNRELVDFFADESFIREYCTCTEQLKLAYNRVLDGYAKYLKLHGTFIQNFILNMSPTFNGRKMQENQKETGILRIIQKSKFVTEQSLKYIEVVLSEQSQQPMQSPQPL